MTHVAKIDELVSVLLYQNVIEDFENFTRVFTTLNTNSILVKTSIVLQSIAILIFINVELKF